ncbi:hypothetical protein [Pseudomonas sp.]|uniref:hypothetical protein n=1 Tax=Pseudomonas sp. TaxID=306 RepID=UPI0028AB101D|nr:hypothetical protein [Pseudomonas sp.]
MKREDGASHDGWRWKRWAFVIAPWQLLKIAIAVRQSLLALRRVGFFDPLDQMSDPVTIACKSVLFQCRLCRYG